MSFAGSAIAQGVNCLEDLVRGFPSTKWLLLAGSSDPPCKTSTRKARDCDREGSFLRGVTNDLALMEKSPMVKNCLHNTVRDFYLTKAEAIGKLRGFFTTCRRDGTKPIIYYTGQCDYIIFLSHDLLHCSRRLLRSICKFPIVYTVSAIVNVFN